jgi:uncharacterized protein (TIGR04255 family)
MLLKQYLRLGGGNHAIKQASLSLFFGSEFTSFAEVRKLIGTELSDLFNQARDLNWMEVEVKGRTSQPEIVSSSAQVTGPVGFQAAQLKDGVTTRILQVSNEDERVSLSLHNLRYGRWADFLALFERILATLAPSLADSTIIGASLHYVDELEWTHPDEPLPIAELYKPNEDYFPRLFFKSSLGEVTLTAPQMVSDLLFFDRLHITSAANGRPVVNISHNVVHQFEKSTRFSLLLEQPNRLSYVLQQAHEHNKNVLREILQPEVQEFIGLIPTLSPTEPC